MRHELALAIGKTIARWRGFQGITQEQLALALDVDPVTVSRFERGVTLPSLPTLHRIAGVFGIPLARLFEDAPQEKQGCGNALGALMRNLSATEQEFVLDTIKRFCAMKKKTKQRQ